MKKLLPYIFSISVIAFIFTTFVGTVNAFSFGFSFPTPRVTYPGVRTTTWITPSPTKMPTPSPTQKLTPTPTKSLTPTPTAGSSAALDEKQRYILDAINSYRGSQGLDKVSPEKNTCSFATIRAKEIVTSFNHNGFSNRANSKTLPYPSYSNVTENIAMNSDYKKVVTSWINSSGHAANMRANTPYVCVAYSGNYYAYEGWKP